MEAKAQEMSQLIDNHVVPVVTPRDGEGQDALRRASVSAEETLPTTRRCGACDKVIPLDARFCAYCGAPG